MSPLELVPMTGEIMAAILAGRREEAAELLGARLPDQFPDDDDRPLLELRRRQMGQDVRYRRWCLHAVVLDGELIGHAGFHGPPGVNSTRDPDAVEFGYTILPPWRGHGYAAQAAARLMELAGEWAGIRHFVLAVAPGNEQSLAIVRKLGFVKTGEHIDDEDGLEWVFERDQP